MLLLLLLSICYGPADCLAQNGLAEKEMPTKDFWGRLKAALNKKQAPDENWNSVTERYDLVYDQIHREEIKLYDSLSKLSNGKVDWDRYQNIVTMNYNRAKDTVLANNLAPNIKVFGWHPHWMGNAWQSYRFNLLSYVAWFSYNIGSNGLHDNPDVMAAWKNAQPMVEAAHAKGCKVLLTITNHTKAGNKAFFENEELQEAAILELLKLLEEGNGDGIDVNFELIPAGYKQQMTRFLSKLSIKLRPRYLLTLAIPAYDNSKTYELPLLADYVDWFVVTGYDYYHSYSPTDGPIAPLNAPAGERSLRTSLDNYLKTGLPREKILLGLPYYGAVWAGKSPTVGNRDSALRFQGHMTYRAIKAKYCLETPQYDLRRWAGHYLVFNQDSNYYEKCWFDDSLTLSRKFDWILQEKLGGMGIWALGYDNGYPELWNLIETKYAADTLLRYQEGYVETQYFRFSKSLSPYRSLIAVAGLFVVVLMLVGMVVALFDSRVRDVFFQHKTLRLLYILGATGILFSIYSFYLYVRQEPLFQNSNFTLVLGLLAGSCLALYIAHWFEKRRKGFP